MTTDATLSSAAPGADYAAAATEAYQAALRVIESVEPRIAAATRKELTDQRESLKLIASENYASPAVLLTMGTWLSDKYAEGTVGHRFYAGCQNVDDIESIAAEHARELFGAPYAYVQPHSGIDANLVAFWAILATRVEAPALGEAGVRNVNDLSEAEWERLRAKLGSQRLMGMSLDAGGHLTHGFRPNISGKMFHQRSYGTDPDTGLLDYDAIAAAAREFKPLILVAGYSAYPRRVNFAKVAEIAHEVGATFMVDMAHFAGLVAGGQHPNPLDHAHVVTTTTHKTLRGPRGGMILSNDEALGKKINSAVFPGLQGGPLMHVIAGKAAAFGEALQPSFKKYAAQVVANAKALAEALRSDGIDLVSGGTDTHVVLADMRPKKVTGVDAEQALKRSHITCNKNGVPFDPEKPMVTSGVRLGSPAGTTRGFGEAEFTEIGKMIADVVNGLAANREGDNGAVEAEVRERVAAMTKRFPIYDL